MKMKNVILLFILFVVNPIYGQWEKLPELLNNDLFDIEVVENGNELFVVGSDISTSPSIGIIYKSIDSGATWDTVYHHDVDSFLGILYKVNIINADTVYVTNSGNRIFKTVDGGANWNILTFPSQEAGPATDAIFFINSEIGFVGNFFGEIFKTVDGGLSWEQVYFLLAFSPIYDINCPTNDICYARSSSPSFLKSIDGGDTWNSVSTVPHTTLLGGMEVLNKDTIILLSSDNLILRSIDGAENWDTIPNPVDAGLLDVHFIDNVGFAVGRKETILRSEDYGATWTVEHFESASFEWIKAVHMNNSNAAFACSNRGSIYRLGTFSSSEEILEEAKILIFPNPFSNRILIEFESPKIGVIEIYDTQGQRIQRMEILSEKSIEVELNDSNSNIFFLNFLEKDSNYKIVKKLIRLE